MRNSVLIILMLAIVSCTGKWQPGDQIKNGHDFLCSAGICDDSLNVANEVNYNDDGAALPHHILDLTACQALGIDKVMGVDTAYSVVRVWGVKDLEGKGISLLLGQTSYSDTRTCWLATYGKDGMIDFMRLGECGQTMGHQRFLLFAWTGRPGTVLPLLEPSQQVPCHREGYREQLSAQ